MTFIDTYYVLIQNKQNNLGNMWALISLYIVSESEKFRRCVKKDLDKGP